MPKINVPESTRILPITGSYCAATDPFLIRDDGVEINPARSLVTSSCDGSA